MKLGVCSSLYRFLPLEQAMDCIADAGFSAVELACGGYLGYGLCDPPALLADDAKLTKFLKVFKGRNIEINGLAVHGNPLHPQAAIRQQHDSDFRNAVLLAERIGLDKIVTFSGCPGDSETAKYPNWAVIAWPTDYAEVLAWQWDTKVIPYWKEAAQFAAEHHVSRIAIEMHPGMVAYNVRSMMRLRDAVGPVIGVNFDPSHLFWQGVDTPRAILELGKAIYHVHLKDIALNPNVATSCTPPI